MASWLAWATKPQPTTTQTTNNKNPNNNNNNTNPSAPPSPEFTTQLDSSFTKQLHQIDENQINNTNITNNNTTNNNNNNTNTNTDPNSTPTAPIFRSASFQWKKLAGVKGFMIDTRQLNHTGVPVELSEEQQSLLTEEQIAGIKQFYEQLRAQLKDQAAAAPASAETAENRALPAESTDEKAVQAGACAGSAQNPISTRSRKAIVVSSVNPEPGAAGGDGDAKIRTDEEVAVLDLDGVEWWTIVEHNNDEKNGKLGSAAENRACTLRGEDLADPASDSDEDGFVVVKEGDYVAALADFISKQLATQYPEAARLPPEQLRKMLDGTFTELKEPGTVGKAWQWGKFLYTTYGWGNTAWNLYKNPAMVRLVASGVFQAATWILVLVL